MEAERSLVCRVLVGIDTREQTIIFYFSVQLQLELGILFQSRSGDFTALIKTASSDKRCPVTAQR